MFDLQGLPCHLYFDLEFNKRENVNKNRDEMVDLLINIIFDAVEEKYGLEGNNNWVVELDNSNEGRVFNSSTVQYVFFYSPSDNLFDLVEYHPPQTN